MKSTSLARITASTLALALLVMPSIGFAAQDSKDSHEREGRSGFFSGWFGAKAAQAQQAEQRNLAPSISGISSPTVIEAGTEGTWTVNASDPEEGTLTYSVDWGDSGIAGFMRSRFSADFVQTSSFSHTYERAGTYTARFTVKDDEGRTSSASATVRVTRSEQSQEIELSNIEVSALTQTSAVIEWDTNLRSNSAVFFGTSSPLDASEAASVQKNEKTRSHRVVLEGLEPDTTYYYLVRSSIKGGDTDMSGEASFTTAGVEDGTPEIESFLGPATLSVDEEGIWTVNASDPENDTLSYAITWGDEGMFSRMFAVVADPVFTQTSTFSHTYATEGTYEVEVTVQDTDGNETISVATVTVSEDEDEEEPTAPVLSTLSALVDSTSITFGWDTNVAADSRVHYSASSPVVGGENTQTVTDGAFGTDHSLRVQGLSAATQYYFVIESEDEEGNATATSEFSLMTLFQ